MVKLYLTKNKSTKELLSYVLKDNNIKSNIVYNEKGKPYLENSSMYFSLSDSGDLTGCVIADFEIGLDIQKLVFREKISKKYFLKEEQEKAINELEFTKIWAKKESYLKFLGEGLSYGLTKVNTLEKEYYINKKDNYIIAIYPYNEDIIIKEV